MTKKLAALFLVFALLISGTLAFAAEPSEIADGGMIAPQYEDISTISPGLSVSGTTATYSLIVRGSYDVTKLSAKLQIQKRNANGTYSNYGTSWTATSNSYYLFTVGTKTVASGGTYRLKVTVTAYTNVGSSIEIAYS